MTDNTNNALGRAPGGGNGHIHGHGDGGGSYNGCGGRWDNGGGGDTQSHNTRENQASSVRGSNILEQAPSDPKLEFIIQMEVDLHFL